MISDQQFAALRKGLAGASVSDAHATAALRLVKRWAGQFDMSLKHGKDGGVRLAADIPLTNRAGITVLVVAPMKTKLKLSFHRSARLPESAYDANTTEDPRGFRPVSVPYAEVDARLSTLDGLVAKCVEMRV